MIIYKKKIPIYFGELLVIFNDDFEEVTKKYRLDIEEPNNCGGWSIQMSNGLGATRYMIILQKTTRHSIISHEALHTVNRILFDRGIESDYSNDEAECYLIGYIIKEIYTFAKKNDIIIEI